MAEARLGTGPRTPDPQAVGLMVARCAQLAGIAIRTLRAGGNVVGVSKLLGHSSTNTTARYVDHPAPGELRELIPHLPREAA